jgi:predicted RNA-binding protein YlqC (UPF0109 family)
MNEISPYLSPLRNVIEAMAPGKIDEVDERVMSRLACLTIRPDARSFGALIGAKGATFKALKVVYGVLVSEAFRFQDYEVSVEPPSSAERFRHEFKVNPSFSKDTIEELIRGLTDHLFPDGCDIRAVDMTSELVAIELDTGQHLQEDFLETIEDALQKIFHAVGMTRGRKIKIALS